MLFMHNRRYYNVAQGGMDVAPSFLKAWGVLLGTLFSRQGNRESKLNYLRRLSDAIFCLQEVHGRDEFHQAIQVLAPRFFCGTFIPGNENAGGSAICIHRKLLPEEAVVTHLVICQGRDHLVNIQSGRHNLVIVDVLFGPELTLKAATWQVGSYSPALACISQ